MKPYCTKEEIAIQTGLDPVKYGTAVDFMILAASQNIDLYCNRPDGFYKDNDYSEREFVSYGLNWLYLDETPDINTVAVKPHYDSNDFEDWSNTDWRGFSGSVQSPNYNSKPYNKLIVVGSTHSTFSNGVYRDCNGFEVLIPTVKVSAKWGYADETPPVIKQATIAQVTRWFKRAQSAWADAIANAEFQELRFVNSLDPDIHFMLNMSGMIRKSLGKNKVMR